MQAQLYVSEAGSFVEITGPLAIKFSGEVNYDLLLYNPLNPRYFFRAFNPKSVFIYFKNIKNLKV